MLPTPISREISLYCDPEDGHSLHLPGNLSAVSESYGLGATLRHSGHRTVHSSKPMDLGAIISRTGYAQRCNDMMALHHDLSSLSVDFPLDLPKVVVLGERSAGKSTLLEAISGINVPTDTTRCPIKYTMHPSSSGWSCDVYVHFAYDTNGLQTGQTPKHFQHCTSKEMLPFALCRAQLAVLNPHERPEKFLNMSDEELQRIKDRKVLRFSRNTIYVDIRDPNATGISFVDLPGLSVDEMPGDIDVLRVICKEHGSGSNTLILVAVSTSDIEDVEGQESVDLARTIDPSGNQTIVVLTKADLLDSRASSATKAKWENIIDGKNEDSEVQLPHGLYCVQLVDEHDSSRKPEDQVNDTFFKTTSPWSEMVNHLRFGVVPLAKRISEALVRMIENNIPRMSQEVQKLIDVYEAQLGKLPFPVKEHPSSELAARINHFCMALKEAIDGDDFDTTTGDISATFVNKNQEHYHNFSNAIRHTVPHFQPVPGSAPNNRFAEEHEQPSSASGGGTGPLDLTYVRNIIRSSTGWRLPHHVPFAVTRSLVLRSTKLWQKHVDDCFKEVSDNLFSLIRDLIQEHFGAFEQLRYHISELVLRKVSYCKDEAELSLRKVMEQQKLRPGWTQNVEDYNAQDKRFLKQYVDAYKSHMSRQNQSSQQQASANRGGKGADRETSTPGPTLEDSALEHYKEIVVMAKVRAYFQISYKRIIDIVPLTIEQDLCQALTDELRKSLFEHFQIDHESQDLMDMFSSEHSDIITERIRLGNRKLKLEAIKKKLERQTRVYSISPA